MQMRMIRLLRRVFMVTAYSAAGALVVLIVVFIAYMERRPDLEVWRLAELDEEMPKAEGFVLLSPAIVVTGAAAIAVADRRGYRLGERIRRSPTTSVTT